MSFGIVYCPPTVEVGQLFEITLGNTLYPNASKVKMEISCDAPSGEHRVAILGSNFGGEEDMEGSAISQARFAWPRLRFFQSMANATWTVKFTISRTSPSDTAIAETTIQVLPHSGGERYDVKPHGGVYRQVAPDGSATDDAA